MTEQKAIEIGTEFAKALGYEAHDFEITARYIKAQSWNPQDHWAVVFTAFTTQEGPIIEIDPATGAASLSKP